MACVLRQAGLLAPFLSVSRALAHLLRRQLVRAKGRNHMRQFVDRDSPTLLFVEHLHSEMICLSSRRSKIGFNHSGADIRQGLQFEMFYMCCYLIILLDGSITSCVKRMRDEKNVPEQLLRPFVYDVKLVDIPFRKA